MKQKPRIKTKEHLKDLDQRINTFHIQNEEEREKALDALIVDIIVQATLKEYYETNGSTEKKQ